MLSCRKLPRRVCLDSAVLQPEADEHCQAVPLSPTVANGHAVPANGSALPGYSSVTTASNGDAKPAGDKRLEAGESPAENGSPTLPGKQGRDTQGRFSKGNACSRGNPFARRLAALRDVLLAAISEEDVQAIAQVLVARAKQGDVAAAKVILSYVIGKATEAVNPDTLDLDEWRLHQQQPTAGELSAALETLSPHLAYVTAKVISGVLGEEFVRKLKGTAENEEKE